MVTKIRKYPHNLYDFLKEHPDLTPKVTEENTLSISFPENCSSSTLITRDGYIIFIQYATFDAPGLFTYDALKDPHYYQNLKRVLAELTN